MRFTVVCSVMGVGMAIHMLCHMFHCDIGTIGGTVLYFYETVVCCVYAELIVYSATSIL